MSANSKYTIAVVLALTFSYTSTIVVMKSSLGWTTRGLEANAYLIIPLSLLKSIFIISAFKISRKLDRAKSMIGTILLILDVLFYFLLFLDVAFLSGPGFG